MYVLKLIGILDLRKRQAQDHMHGLSNSNEVLVLQANVQGPVCLTTDCLSPGHILVTPEEAPWFGEASPL